MTFFLDLFTGMFLVVKWVFETLFWIVYAILSAVTLIIATFWKLLLWIVFMGAVTYGLLWVLRIVMVAIGAGE